MSFNGKRAIRQVHLDFHTSPDIMGIGSRFSKENFQKALKLANIDSITVFAKCHHSLCYYPTDIGIRHPNLDFDLTGAMVDAAHEIGVRAPIYITAGWSDADAVNHPEWRAVLKDGNYMTTKTFQADATYGQPKKDCSWQLLCLNDGGYAKHIYALTEEVCRRYENVDGLFFDICVYGDACYCETCKQGMKEMGLNPDNEEDAKKYFSVKRQTFMKKCRAILEKYHPGASIFFNSGGADVKRPQYHSYQSHFEMEDLPTAWGGYDKLPLRAKYFVNSGKNSIAMTGKFHLSWGEFGGFKTKEALKFEVVTMALYGAGASVGDHMHPDGELEMQTYENIGFAYDYLAKIEQYCYNGINVSDVGIYLSPNGESNDGISKILLENHIDFEVITNKNLEKYSLIIIPDGVILDAEGIRLLNAYIDNGGSLIMMADALVKDGKFQIDAGVSYVGEPEYDCDYMICMEKSDALPSAPLLCNVSGYRTEVKDAEVLAEFVTPYFSRTYGHFCGHKNTPYDKASKRFPAIVKKGNVIYLSHSLPKQYYTYGSVFHKYYFMFALNKIYREFLHIEGLGAEGRCTVICQPEKSRYCMNVVYASPVRREIAEIIEDIMPVYDIMVQMKTDKIITNVYMPLSQQELAFEQKDGEVSFAIPKLECHTTVVMEY